MLFQVLTASQSSATATMQDLNARDKKDPKSRAEKKEEEDVRQRRLKLVARYIWRRGESRRPRENRILKEKRGRA